MQTEKTYWYDLKINDDNKGFIYGINYIDNDEIIECEWFKTKQERNKKMFLDYASAFDYTEDFHYNAKENGKPITWEQAIKENDEFMKSMNCWSLKDFQEWFDFRKFEI